MSAVTSPRGPLPSRVYWTRRILLLLVVFGLVFGLGRLLSGGGGDSEGDSASPVGSSTRSEAPTGTPVATPTPSESTGAKGGKARLAQPDGPCEPEDVVVTPVVKQANVAEPVKVVLKLTTRVTDACTFQVSPSSVIMAITSGDDPIWSSQQCRTVLPTETVIAREAKAAKVTVTWNGRRSDDECSDRTDWARGGWYHVEAVARGSVRPVDVQFRMEGPVQATITRAPSPTPKAEPEKPKKDKEQRTGATEPDDLSTD